MLWGGNDCGQDEGHEIPKATIRTADYCGSKQTEDCGIFQQFWLLDAKIYMKLNLVFPWKKQDSTRSALSLQVGLKIQDDVSKVMHLGQRFCCVGTEHLGK